MFTLIFIAVISAIVIYYVRKSIKPKGLENVPYVSVLPLAWAYIQGKYYDEIGDLIHKLSGGHDIYLASSSEVTLASPELVKDLLLKSEDDAQKHESESFMANVFGNGMPFSNGDKWRTYRKLANPTFNHKLYPEIVGETVMDLFSFMQKNINHPVDAPELMRRITIEVLGVFAFDHKFGYLDSDETPHIINVYRHIMSTIVSPLRSMFPWINRLPTKSNKKFFNALDEFNGFIFDMVESKRNKIKNNEANSRSGRVDLLTSMLEMSKKEGVNADTKQLRDEMVAYFIAGHDTNTTALSVSLYYLAKNPEIQEKARAEVISILGDELIIPNSDHLKELKYINAIIKESLRIHPPVPIITWRKLKSPTKIGPYIIPQNFSVSASAWEIHNNPKYWENPKQYNPERFLTNEKRHPFSWIPFSAGPRNCIGQNYALMAQRVILSMILHKYKWTLPENSINKDKLFLEPGFLLKPTELKLLFIERN